MSHRKEGAATKDSNTVLFKVTDVRLMTTLAWIVVIIFMTASSNVAVSLDSCQKDGGGCFVGSIINSSEEEYFFLS